ncbi:MAG: VTT domain-containing protein [Mycoplasmatota bacterium]
MEAIIIEVVQYIKELSVNNEFLCLLVCFLIINLESIFPMIPLSAFITVNIIIFGNFTGFILSYIATLIGCSLAFFLIRKGIKIPIFKKIENTYFFKNSQKIISNMDFSSLVLISSLPFTPAFLINIACGISNMSYKKFISALILGKLSMVYFWAFIGTTLIQSITDIRIVFLIILFMTLTFILSKIINKKFNII